MPYLERFLILWNIYCAYIPNMKYSVSKTFCTICHSLTRCKVHLFGRRWCCHKKFKLGPCFNLKDSLISWYVFCSYVPNMKYSVSLTYISYLPLPWCLVMYIFLEFFHKKIQVGPSQLERFLISWYVFCLYVPNMKHSVSSTFFLYLTLPNAL